MLIEKCINVKNYKRKIDNFEKKSPFNVKVLVISLVVLAVICYLFTSFLYKETNNIKKISLSDNAYISINGGSEHYGSIKNILTSKKVSCDDNVKIRFKIPNNCEQIINPVISSISPNSIVKIYFDGKEVYSLGEGKKYGDIIGSVYIKAPILEDYSGKEVCIELHILDKSAISNIYNVYIINTYDADRIILTKNFINILVGLFMTTFGIICLAYNLFGFKSHYEIKKEVWISLMSICGGGWILSCFLALQYFNISSVYKYYIEYESLYFLVFFASLAVYEKMKNTSQGKIFNVNFILILGYILIVNILRTFKIVYFQQLLPIFQIIIIISIALMLYISIKNKKNNKGIAITAGLLFVAAVIYAFIYNTQIEESIVVLNIVAISVFALIIYMFVSLANEIALSYLDNKERKTLMEMAFEDNLTGIPNRRACEKYIQQIDNINDGKFLVYSFDINCLKIINDTKGHKTGDLLIKDFANAIKDVFSDENSFVGRMGGDEFLVIHSYDEDKERNYKLHELRDKVNKINEIKDREYLISYAAGISLCDKDKNMKIWDVYNKADKKMYKVKEKKHKEEV